jgi:PAS domain S-box-containing protein
MSLRKKLMLMLLILLGIFILLLFFFYYLHKNVISSNQSTIAATSANFIDISFYFVSILVIIMALSFIILGRMISKPLSGIISAIEKNDSSKIENQLKQDDEFGQIARLVNDFFKQKKDLAETNEEIILQKDEIYRQSKKNELSRKVLRVLNQNLTNQTNALNETAMVTITDVQGIIKYVNDKFYQISGYSEHDIIEQNPRVLKAEGIHSSEFYRNLWETISVKKTNWRGEICNKFKDGSLHWFDMTVVPFLDNSGEVYQYIAIKIDIDEKKKAEQEIRIKNTELLIQKLELEEKNNEITSSIEYAKNIQRAMMPSDDLLDELLPRYFVLLQPKYIVSGDFYWATRDKHKIFFAVGDCTGHGVPGAFMSALGVSLLNEIVQRKDIFKPALILDELRRNLKKAMHQTDEDYFQRDGLDIALCAIDLNTMMLEYAGANRNLYLVRRILEQKIITSEFALKANIYEYSEYTLLELKGDKMPIGVHHNSDNTFSQASVKIRKRDTFYLASDGFQDQFGGAKNKKFGSKRLKQCLVEIQKNSITEQKQLLHEKFNSWKGENEQTDDMLIIGLKF